MLTYFRRIRKGLVDSSPVRKYLLYAIGEIVLVVFGILIALQINNWNEARKETQQENKFLQRLAIDLQSDLNYFNRRLKESQEEVDKYYSLIHQAYDEQKTKEEFINLLSLGFLSSEQLTIKNSTYSEMLNAGQIDIIKNDSLKISIIDLYRRYDEVGKHIEEINEFTSKMLIEMSKANLAFKYNPRAQQLFDEPGMFDESEWEWINDPKSYAFRMSEQTYALYSFKHNIFMAYFKDLMQEIQRLQKLIQGALNID